MSGRGSRSSVGWATLTLAALVLVLLGPALIGSRVLSPNDVMYAAPPFAAQAPPGWRGPSNPNLNDSGFVFQPELHQVRRALRSGQLPLWNDTIGGGRPQLAAQQTAPLYPLTWLAALLPFWEAMGWIAALKLLIAGVGMAVFLRGLGLRAPACVLGAVSFGTSTLLIVWMEHPHAGVFGLTPWCLAAVDRAARRPDAPLAGMGLIALPIGLQGLAGHPETFALSLALTVAYAGLRFPWRRALLLMSGGGALGLAISAPMLLPLVEMLGQSVPIDRGKAPAAPETVFGFTLPEFWGRADKMVFGSPNGGLAGQGLYVGAPVVLLTTLARGRTARFFAGAFVLGLLVALESPISNALTAAPLVGRVNLGYGLWPALLSVVVLGALGCDRLLRGTCKWGWRGVLPAVAVVVAPLLIVITQPGVIEAARAGLGQLPTLDADVASADVAGAGALWRWTLLGVVVLAGLALSLRRRSAAAAVVVCGIVLTGADLVSLGHGYHPLVPPSTAAPDEPPALTALRGTADAGRMAAAPSVFAQNLGSTWDVRDARAHQLPVLARPSHLWYDLAGIAAPIGRHRLEVDVGAPGSAKLLDLYGVRAVLDDGRGPAPPGYSVAFEHDSGRVLRRPSAHPAAWYTSRWRTARTEADARAGVRTATAQQLYEAPVVEARARAHRRARSVVATVRRMDDRHVAVSVVAPAPGMLVLNDIVYPGWRARIGDRELPIHAANVSFRAVAVPAGRVTVQFTYEPTSVRVGVALCLVGLLMLSAIAIVSRRSPRDGSRRREGASAGG